MVAIPRMVEPSYWTLPSTIRHVPTPGTPPMFDVNVPSSLTMTRPERPGPPYAPVPTVPVAEPSHSPTRLLASPGWSTTAGGRGAGVAQAVTRASVTSSRDDVRAIARFMVSSWVNRNLLPRVRAGWPLRRAGRPPPVRMMLGFDGWASATAVRPGPAPPAAPAHRSSFPGRGGPSVTGILCLLCHFGDVSL